MATPLLDSVLGRVGDQRDERCRENAQREQREVA